MERGTTAVPDRLAEGAGATVVARVLGGFDVVVRGRPLTHTDWQRVSAERLVKLLLVTPGHRLRREAAAETLWPDAPPEASRANLRKAVHFARRALAGTELLGADPACVWLRAARLDLDLDRLAVALDRLGDAGPDDGRDHAAAAADGSGPGLDEAIASIVRLGPRPLLPDDAYDDWLAIPRERLRDRWQRTAIRAARRARDLGRPAEAHEIVAQLIDCDPTDEAAHRLAIELYAAAGRHHAARRQLEQCRLALREGLDVEPSAETFETFRAAEGSADRAPAAIASPTGRLVARQTELERIEPLLDRVASGYLAALVIRGPAGVGKTRLLQEVVAYAGAAGWQAIGWQAVESARSLPYAPLRIGFADRLTRADTADWDEPARSGLAALVPGLVDGGVAFEDRAALVTALVAAVGRLARRRPLVLTIDDLPWLDAPTLEVLRAIAAGLPTARILVAGTYRDDEPVGEAVVAYTDEVRRIGGLEVVLGPLARRDIGPLLVTHLGGDAAEPALVRAAFEQSAGNPLFCLELARSAIDGGTVRLRDGRWSLASDAVTLGGVPDSVRRLVAGRAAALPEGTRDLLATAAELGPEISFGTLSTVVPLASSALIDALDRALSAGLLVEAGAGYAFAHPLYRLAVRDATGTAQRGTLRSAIARALAGGPPGEATGAELEALAAASVDPVPVAEHALGAADLGVADALPLAVAFGVAAGERAGRLFDRERAIALLERSLAAWHRLPPAEAAGFGASTAAVRLAALRIATGDDAGVTAAFHEAVSAARGPDELTDAYVVFCEVPYRHGDFEAALATVDEGLARMPADASVARARLMSERGWCLVRLRRFDEALEALEVSLRVQELAGYHGGVIKTLDRIGMLRHYLGRNDEAAADLERSLALALELADSRGELLARAHLGVVLTRSGHPARARTHQDRALELASLMGDRYAEAVTAWGAAEMEDALGRYEAAIELRHRELSLLAAMGGNPHNEAMSHAHLAHLARVTGDTAVAAREARAARQLAARSEDPDYPARVEQALAVRDWSELQG